MLQDGIGVDSYLLGSVEVPTSVGVGDRYSRSQCIRTTSGTRRNNGIITRHCCTTTTLSPAAVTAPAAAKRPVTDVDADVAAVAVDRVAIVVAVVIHSG